MKSEKSLLIYKGCGVYEVGIEVDFLKIFSVFNFLFVNLLLSVSNTIIIMIILEK